ncbi:MAG TPA: WcaF family extracellular polysaccharide biosynthesis acetyltransferase [Saprospiraceae bacterium]|nr:WcaF family extracellular polysaccharide biosynthesis acetyltransferase [Saprospiraceae bacterium]
MKTTDLATFDNSSFSIQANLFKRLTWYYFNLVILKSSYFPFVKAKSIFLSMFGSKVGKGIVIKPAISIKYPWLLSIGNHTWIGENVWIDNLVQVSIGNHVCISQGAMLLTGNHNYKKSSFDLVTGEIFLEDGVWIGAKAIVCPGVRCGSHSVLTVGSVATHDLEPYGIYQGNPAVLIKKREIN